MALTETHDYDDIINLPHHQSRRHARMALSGRAAQFMPFAALTGYEDVLNRTVRVNEEAIARLMWRKAICRPELLPGGVIRWFGEGELVRAARVTAAVVCITGDLFRHGVCVMQQSGEAFARHAIERTEQQLQSQVVR